MLLSAERSVLIVIDVQERLAPAMHGLQAFLRNTEILMRAAARLAVPVIITEQYPKGLGRTVESISALAAPDAVVEKITFSAVDSDDFRQRLDVADRPEPVICGIEAHVCVLQTALGLRDRGRRVWLVRDATASRRPDSVAAAMERAARFGMQPVTTEMVVFEWLRQAGTPEFRELSALIK